MHVFAFLLMAQSLAQTGPQRPVLEFPEPGLDDPAAYEGYSTRFFRDSRGNAFQIYVDATSGRVVHLWADGANESAAFTVRDPAGDPAPVTWGGSGAEAFADDRERGMRHRLTVRRDAIEIGWFLLGTMRQERDFQYWQWHRRPFGQGQFALEELTGLVANLERLPGAEQERQLAVLNASSLEMLRSRLTPRVSLGKDAGQWVATVEHRSLDGNQRMTLEFRGDTVQSTVRRAGDALSVRSRAGSLAIDVTVTTNADAVIPLTWDEIFNDAFTTYYQRRRADADRVGDALPPGQRAMDPTVRSFRLLERNALGLELLASRNKLMAALPNYATYFGRDMLMSALMLEPIASVDLREYVITNALRKLSPSGDVSHEEAVGGQAIREAAAEYNGVIREWVDVVERDPRAGADLLARARGVLSTLAAVRENHRMIDDDFQLPVVVGRYLSLADVPAARKRRFLTEPLPDGRTRLEGLVRNLALVAERTRPYAEHPEATNLVGFLFRDDGGWLPGSWRDSRVGYGGGRFGMDVNALWVPQALEATARILATLDTLGLSPTAAISRVPGGAFALEGYVRDRESLRRAITTWQGARRHFEVRLDAGEVAARVDAMLASLPEVERRFWRTRLEETGAGGRPLRFLALSLTDDGRPIAAPNTDNATALFLGNYTEDILQGRIEPSDVDILLDVLRRPYPVGLAVDGLGPVVVNDAYASDAVREGFRRDLYHSPRVVWGREVNLILLGLARQIAAAYDERGRLRSNRAEFRSYVEGMRQLLESTRRAVDASGMRHNELWSYRIEGDTLRPVRYGTSSDIQLWNLTDLAVQFVLDRLPPR